MGLEVWEGVCQGESMWKLQPQIPEFTAWSGREGNASSCSLRAFPRDGTFPFLGLDALLASPGLSDSPLP